MEIKKHILLHVCCGPCSIVPVQRLRDQGFELTGLFVNPNIHPLSEYLQRRETMAECADKLALPMLWRDDLWDIQAWTYEASSLQAKEQNRCLYCYSSRLDICAQMANEQGFDAFCSSLLYSRYQNHEHIVNMANEAANRHKINFFYDDFRDEWQKGIDLSKEFNLYRQKYCGCIYSEAERYSKKLNKLQQMN